MASSPSLSAKYVREQLTGAYGPEPHEDVHISGILSGLGAAGRAEEVEPATPNR